MATPELAEPTELLPTCVMADEPYDHDLDESEDPDETPADPEQDGASDHTPPEES